MKAMKIECVHYNYKEMYDKEFEAHMKTKQKYIDEANENLELMEKNDKLERQLRLYEDEIEELKEKIKNQLFNYYGID